MVSLSLLAIRPCALQSAAAAPRPHWWIQNMQNNMISILDKIPKIEESMLKAKFCGTYEQLEFIHAFVQLIGDVHTNAKCQLPVLPYCDRDSPDDPAKSMCPNYRDYVTLIHKVRPHVDNASKQGVLAGILCQVNMLGLENQQEANVKCNLIEYACMFDQEFDWFQTVEWVDAQENIRWELNYHNRNGTTVEYFHEIAFSLHWPEIETSNWMEVCFFANLQDPRNEGWFSLAIFGKLPNED